jgi:hypothetical protein
MVEFISKKTSKHYKTLLHDSHKALYVYLYKSNYSDNFKDDTLIQLFLSVF